MAWIGLSDLKTEGQFLWESTSEPISFNNWGPHDPNNIKGIEHCVLINWERQWVDAPCNWKKTFVCQGKL